jgi:hypothetical protein
MCELENNYHFLFDPVETMYQRDRQPWYVGFIKKGAPKTSVKVGQFRINGSPRKISHLV